MAEIEWSPTAESEFIEILEYITHESPQYALSFYDQVQENLANISEFPEIGRIVPELDEQNVRELIIGSYRLIYRNYTDKIQIIRLLHGARNFRL